MTFEERAQKFHTVDESLPKAGLGSASDWLKNPWGVTRHQYGISAVIAQTYSQGKPLSEVRLFSQTSGFIDIL